MSGPAAEALFVESYGILKSTLGEQDSRTMDARQHLKTLYEAWHKPEKAVLY